MHEDPIITALRLDGARRSAAWFFAPPVKVHDPKLAAFEGRNDVLEVFQQIAEFKRDIAASPKPDVRFEGIDDTLEVMRMKEAGWTPFYRRTMEAPDLDQSYWLLYRHESEDEVRVGDFRFAGSGVNWSREFGWIVIGYSTAEVCPPRPRIDDAPVAQEAKREGWLSVHDCGERRVLDARWFLLTDRAVFICIESARAHIRASAGKVSASKVSFDVGCPPLPEAQHA